MIKFIAEGGAFMYVILAVSFIGVALILQRLYLLTYCYKFKDSFFERIIDFIKSGNLKEAYRVCRTTTHPLANIICEILRHYNRSKATIESAAGVSIQKVIPRIQKNTSYIQMLANISTLLGLLGTIQGLIQSFSSLAGANPAEKAALLAKGISTAMNTTALGLIVAIPFIAIYAIIINKETAILQKYDETVSEVVHLIGQDKDEPHDKVA